MSIVDMGPDAHQPRYQLTPGERAELAAHAARCGICISSSGGHCNAYRDIEWLMERNGREQMRDTVEVPVLTPQQIDEAMMRAVRATPADAEALTQPPGITAQAAMASQRRARGGR